MRYYLDTEFIEGTQKLFWGESKLTIDLISIALVDENGREFYAISKDFNLKEAWNRWQQRTGEGDRNNNDPRHYWIRENVLYPVFLDLIEKNNKAATKIQNMSGYIDFYNQFDFSYSNFKKLLNIYGLTNKQIANNICAFIYDDDYGGSGMSAIEMAYKYEMSNKFINPEFYGYYSDYDWVVFCWLFGKMNDLPIGFPKYCKDLKQMLDEVTDRKNWWYGEDVLGLKYEEIEQKDRLATFDEKLEKIKNLVNYPLEPKSHNALLDARFNIQLHEFIKKL